MKNITKSPITTILGVIIALFTLVGLTGKYFERLDYATVLLLTTLATALIFGKDSIFTRFTNKK